MIWEAHLITIHVEMVRALVVVTIIHIHMELVVVPVWHLAVEVWVHVRAQSLRDAVVLHIFTIEIIFRLIYLLLYEL